MISSPFSFVIFILLLPRQNVQVVIGSSRGSKPIPKQRGQIPFNIAISSMDIDILLTKKGLTISSSRPATPAADYGVIV
jgi:hypothetical protein